MTTVIMPAADAAGSASRPAIAHLSFHAAAIIVTKPYSEAFSIAGVVTARQRMLQPPTDKHHLPLQLARLEHCLESAPTPQIPDTVVGLLIATIVVN